MGLTTILIEQRDFAWGTSSRSSKLVHGGLRYLQSADLRRFSQSTRERSWLMRSFPEHCAPLDCLMPLYDRGLRRPLTFGAALTRNTSHIMSA